MKLRIYCFLFVVSVVSLNMLGGESDNDEVDAIGVYSTEEGSEVAPLLGD